jgi:DNA polymerase/3'-5' exonuclease PolX
MVSKSKIVEMLEAFLKYYTVSGHPQGRFKVRAFQNGIAAVKRLDTVPAEKKELVAISGIGKGIADRIIELQTTGTVKEWDEKIKQDPQIKAQEELASVLGIGPVLAKKMIADGIMSVSELKKAVEKGNVTLTSSQLIGLSYYKQLKRRIPRDEVSSFRKYIARHLKKFDQNSKMVIAGSYRRGRPDCGDVDVLISDPDIKTQVQAKKKKAVLKNFIEKLFETEVAIEQISLGATKYMGLFRWPKGSDKVLKADIRFVPDESYVAALVYFTGSRDHNLLMRRKAQQMGYKLNEYGLFDSDGKRKRFDTERELFKILEIPYKGPTKR